MRISKYSNNYNLVCHLCKGKLFKTRFAKKKASIKQCRRCGLGMLYPVPKTLKQDFYEKSYFVSEGSSGYKDYQAMNAELEREAQTRLLEIAKYAKPPARLLDIGAGLGLFAASARDKGYRTEIIDVSGYAVGAVFKNYKIKGWQRDLSGPLKLAKKYKIITAWDVVEHIKGIENCFSEVNKALERGGLFFLSTPNLDSWDAKLLGKWWYGFTKIPEHIFYLTPASLSLIADKCGFRVLAIKPGGFYRSVNFLISKLLRKSVFRGSILNVFKILGLERKILYFPMVDMFAALEKK